MVRIMTHRGAIEGKTCEACNMLTGRDVRATYWTQAEDGPYAASDVFMHCQAHRGHARFVVAVGLVAGKLQAGAADIEQAYGMLREAEAGLREFVGGVQ